MNMPACFTVEMESLLNSFKSSMHKPLKFFGGRELTELVGGGLKRRLVPPRKTGPALYVNHNIPSVVQLDLKVSVLLRLERRRRRMKDTPKAVLKVCLVPLTHETKYASGTMKFVDFWYGGGSSGPQDTPSYGPGHCILIRTEDSEEGR